MAETLVLRERQWLDSSYKIENNKTYKAKYVEKENLGAHVGTVLGDIVGLYEGVAVGKGSTKLDTFLIRCRHYPYKIMGLQ